MKTSGNPEAKRLQLYAEVFFFRFNSRFDHEKYRRFQVYWWFNEKYPKNLDVYKR